MYLFRFVLSFMFILSMHMFYTSVGLAQMPLPSGTPTPPPSGYCGDGIIQAPETCDDGDNYCCDGCSGTCQIEASPTPSPSSSPTSTSTCGNGAVEGTEQCDMGLMNGTTGCPCSTNCTWI